MSYNVEIVSKNVERLIHCFDCTNGVQIDELKKKSDYDDPVNELPGKHTINKLLKKIPSNIKDYSFEGFVRAYNKIYHTNISIVDFKETLLPFEVERTIPDLYEDTYYLYDYWAKSNKLTYGIAQFYIEDNQYKVKLCLRIFNEELFDHPALMQLFHDTKSGYREYIRIFNTLEGEAKQMNYYEGTMNFQEDYCVITLKDCGNLNTQHDQTIFIRNYRYDFRSKLLATIGIRVFKNYTTDLRVKRLLFSKVRLAPNDPYVLELIRNVDPNITDQIEYQFYKYVRNKLQENR